MFEIQILFQIKDLLKESHLNFIFNMQSVVLMKETQSKLDFIPSRFPVTTKMRFRRGISLKLFSGAGKTHKT